MLTLIMKRNLTNQDKKDIEECFIKFNREEIKFDDGIKFVVNKSIHAIPNPPQKEPLKVTYINISEYYNGANVSNCVYDYMYYMNIIVPLIRNGLGLTHPHECSCSECNSSK